MTLAYTDYPVLYRSADESAARGRRGFFAATAVRLAGLAVAAAAGAFRLVVGPVDLLGFVALTAFVAAAAAETYLLRAAPDDLWFRSRAGAESVKTMTWRYAVGGRPFSLSIPDRRVDAEFVARVAALTRGLADVNIAPATGTEHEITGAMRRIRAMDLAERKQAYEQGRIIEQRHWYATRAAAAAKAATKWSIAVLALECAGLVGAAARAFDVLDVDVLGLLAGAAAACLAWAQASQYQTISRAYGVASHELTAIGALLDHVTDEAEWTRLVQEAEDAISREHTLWLASRPLRGTVA